MSNLVEITTVGRTQPAVNATGDQQAAWYLAKARMHEHLAAEHGSDETTELTFASAAYEHAHRLINGVAA
jgi:hypothetical protein